MVGSKSFDFHTSRYLHYDEAYRAFAQRHNMAELAVA
nr:phage regulatory CII family protein [Cronobacter dublinensis]